MKTIQWPIFPLLLLKVKKKKVFSRSYNRISLFTMGEKDKSICTPYFFKINMIAFHTQSKCTNPLLHKEARLVALQRGQHLFCNSKILHRLWRAQIMMFKICMLKPFEHEDHERIRKAGADSIQSWGVPSLVGEKENTLTKLNVQGNFSGQH